MIKTLEYGMEANSKILRRLILDMNNTATLARPNNVRNAEAYNTIDATPIGVITNNSKRNHQSRI